MIVKSILVTQTKSCKDSLYAIRLEQHYLREKHNEKDYKMGNFRH